MMVFVDKPVENVVKYMQIEKPCNLHAQLGSVFLLKENMEKCGKIKIVRSVQMSMAMEKTFFTYVKKI